MGKIENGEIREIGSSIWQDRKHHLWFPISFTKYSVGDGRLYVTSGLLSSREDECLLYRITDIGLTRSLWQRIMGMGTIQIYSSDQSMGDFKLVNVKDSENVKEQLSQLIEKERENKRVSSREFLGVEEDEGDTLN